MSVAVAVRVMVGEPPLPVTVKTYVPLAVEEPTVRVSVEEVVAGFGLKLPLVPEGRPLTEKVTAELKPLVAPAAVRVSRDELTLAARVLHTFEGPLNLAAFTDQHQVHLRRLIDAKIAGDEYVVPHPVEAPVVRTLLEALTESLAVAKKVPAKATPAKRKQAS